MKKNTALTFGNSLLSVSLLFGSLLSQHANIIDELPRTLAAITNSSAHAQELNITPDFSCNDVLVGLQVGHWNNQNPPAELSFISRNTGATGRGKMEWESNYLIAVESKNILEQHGITVDLLEAVVPPKYQADAVVSIHADGSENTDLTGFKVAPPNRDAHGKSGMLSASIRDAYKAQTGMHEDAKNITENMTDYYTFASHRIEHSVDSGTPAALLETGFLSSPRDQYYLLDAPHVPAQGLAQGIIAYLASQPNSEPCDKLPAA